MYLGLEKWFRSHYRASSFLVFLEFSTKKNREEGRQNNRPINLPKGDRIWEKGTYRTNNDFSV